MVSMRNKLPLLLGFITITAISNMLAVVTVTNDSGEDLTVRITTIPEEFEEAAGNDIAQAFIQNGAPAQGFMVDNGEYYLIGQVGDEIRYFRVITSPGDYTIDAPVVEADGNHQENDQEEVVDMEID